VLVAKCPGLLQVVFVGDNDACLALDRLDEETSEVGAGGLERLTESCLVIVGDGLLSSRDRASDTGQIRAVVLA
jgi:hypothetical protein